jgi:hypothetical protein
MSGYKYPNIDSGATPIGSAGRAPDRKTILRKNSTRREEEEKEIGAYDRVQVSDHSLGGLLPSRVLGAHLMMFFMNNKAKKAKEDFEIIITTTWREFISIKVE